MDIAGMPAQGNVRQNSHRIRKRIAVLLADGDLFAEDIDLLVVEGAQLLDGNDITPVDAAKLVGRQQPFPLFQRDKDQSGGLVLQYQPGIIFPGLDVDDMPEFHLYISPFMTNKEKGLHSTLV